MCRHCCGTKFCLTAQVFCYNKDKSALNPVRYGCSCLKAVPASPDPAGPARGVGGVPPAPPGAAPRPAGAAPGAGPRRRGGAPAGRRGGRAAEVRPVAADADNRARRSNRLLFFAWGCMGSHRVLSRGPNVVFWVLMLGICFCRKLEQMSSRAGASSPNFFVSVPGRYPARGTVLFSVSPNALALEILSTVPFSLSTKKEQDQNQFFGKLVAWNLSTSPVFTSFSRHSIPVPSSWILGHREAFFILD